MRPKACTLRICVNALAPRPPRVLREPQHDTHFFAGSSVLRCRVKCPHLTPTPMPYRRLHQQYLKQNTILFLFQEGDFLFGMKYNRVQQKILEMAGARSPDKTVCPSEIARELFPADWRKHMTEVRDSAVELHQTGEVTITQKGQPIDVNHIKGPIRIK